MSQVITIGLSEKLIVFGGHGLGADMVEKVTTFLEERLPEDERPIILWIPGPIEVVDIRAIPPDIRAAAELVSEWLHSLSTCDDCGRSDGTHDPEVEH